MRGEVGTGERAVLYRSLNDIVPLIVSDRLPVAEALARLDTSGLGILLVRDEGGTLSGVITDGDIRRQLLRGEFRLEDPCSALMNPAPFSVNVEQNVRARRLAVEDAFARGIDHVPLVDENARIAGLYLLGRSPVCRRDVTAVVMAGGLGSRLRPLTEQAPKPLLEVGGRPIIDWIVDGLCGAGIQDIVIATRYQGEKIKAHFGDGREYGALIRYEDETEPLGTAGILHRLSADVGHTLVINGDIVTSLDLGEIVDVHLERGSDATIALREHGLNVPFGVVQTEGERVTRIEEKPRTSWLIYAGIGVFRRPMFKHIAPHHRLDMPDFINRLAAQHGCSVHGYSFSSYWNDVGTPVAFDAARQYHERGE